MFYRATLKTGNKSRESIKERYIQEDWIGELTDENIAAMIEYYDLLDGLNVIVADFDGDYALVAWGKDAEEKIKDAFYIAEQDEYFGTYINDRERFETDWEKGEYYADSTISFGKEEVEIIKALEMEGELII